MTTRNLIRIAFVLILLGLIGWCYGPPPSVRAEGAATPAASPPFEPSPTPTSTPTNTPDPTATSTEIGLTPWATPVATPIATAEITLNTSAPLAEGDIFSVTVHTANSVTSTSQLTLDWSEGLDMLPCLGDGLDWVHSTCRLFGEKVSPPAVITRTLGVTGEDWTIFFRATRPRIQHITIQSYLADGNGTETTSDLFILNGPESKVSVSISAPSVVTGTQEVTFTMAITAENLKQDLKVCFALRSSDLVAGQALIGCPSATDEIIAQIPAWSEPMTLPATKKVTLEPGHFFAYIYIDDNANGGDITPANNVGIAEITVAENGTVTVNLIFLPQVNR